MLMVFLVHTFRVTTGMGRTPGGLVLAPLSTMYREAA